MYSRNAVILGIFALNLQHQMQSVSCYLRNSVSTETAQSTDSLISEVRSTIQSASESVISHKNQMKNNLQKLRERVIETDSLIYAQKGYLYKNAGHKLVAEELGISNDISARLLEYEHARKVYVEKLDLYQPKVDEGLACESDLTYSLVYSSIVVDAINSMIVEWSTFLEHYTRIATDLNGFIKQINDYFEYLNEADW